MKMKLYTEKKNKEELLFKQNNSSLAFKKRRQVVMMNITNKFEQKRELDNERESEALFNMFKRIWRDNGGGVRAPRPPLGSIPLQIADKMTHSSGKPRTG